MPIVKCYDRKRDITYVYESEHYVDKETGKSHYKRRLIGRVDPETGETVPTGSRGGYRPKKERPVQEEWVPMKPGRKKKNVEGATGVNPGGENDSSDDAATIRRLEGELAELREKYLLAVKRYNDLADALKRLVPEQLSL